MNNKLKMFLCFIFSILMLSCGLPDVTGVTLELNQPYITKVIPGNNKLTVEFEAQNNEPSFSGYNIYFGENAWKTPFCRLSSVCGISTAGA